jgi:hypothetical protein
MNSLVLTLNEKHCTLKSRRTVCGIFKNRAMKNISDHDVGELLRTSMAQRGGKPAKYIALGAYRETIVKLMDLNVQLNLIRDWLVEKQGEQLVVNTLRKYIIRSIGRDFYDEYLKRNGWTKTRRTPQPGAPPLPAGVTVQDSRLRETETTAHSATQSTKPPGMTHATWIAEQARAKPKQH